ncbi:hypothetical protein FHL15_000593 [Xylaria flabelliformis]|uniref:Helicase C-terminal domain-containing protein n=1 Tax=Xylaria flabelliformis TaxID=2512241 RepID=A0A553IE95_9PEZI|nr:hypothetical protein FHL15_000593 [Xylaria flabelliformis]
MEGLVEDIHKILGAGKRSVNDERYSVLLMSTGVGAFSVYILEPRWNLHVESQALGRVARLNQHKPIFVTRYFLELAKVEFQTDDSPSST